MTLKNFVPELYLMKNQRKLKHFQTNVWPEVDPLGHHAGDEHEEGVWEEVGRVEGGLQPLGRGLVLAVDLVDERLARVQGLVAVD